MVIGKHSLAYGLDEAYIAAIQLYIDIVQIFLQIMQILSIADVWSFIIQNLYEVFIRILRIMCVQ